MFVYAGIDEAGYGPILGPLCLAAATVTVREHPQAGSAAPPDLWHALAPAVCRTRAEWRRNKQRSLVIADSKHAKLPNDTATTHPLTHLERAVLASLPEDRAAPRTDTDLFDALGLAAADAPWYAERFACDLPASTTRDHLALLTARLRRAAASAGVSFLNIGADAIPEASYNRSLERLGSKAAVNLAAACALADRVRRSAAARAAHAEHGEPVRIVIDRQSGRSRYAQAVSQTLGGQPVRTIAEDERRSVYEIDATPDAKAAPVRLSFETEAESRHLPVALASMTAKLVRELMMARLNAYWRERLPELKPTAGYYQDGKRFLDDLAGAGFRDDAKPMIRNA
jgi:ribonuclease HII